MNNFIYRYLYLIEDDEPRDGPHHYIIFSGFFSPTFFNFVDEYQIPVDCLMKFKTPNHDLIIKFMDEIEDREKLETNLKVNLKINPDPTDKNINIDALSDERQSHLNKLRYDIERFWSEVNKILEKPEDKKMLQHIARLKYTLKHEPELKSWFDLDARVNNIFLF